MSLPGSHHTPHATCDHHRIRLVERAAWRWRTRDEGCHVRVADEDDLRARGHRHEAAHYAVAEQLIPRIHEAVGSAEREDVAIRKWVLGRVERILALRELHVVPE